MIYRSLLLQLSISCNLVLSGTAQESLELPSKIAISARSGTFLEPIVVELEAPEGADQLRYTLNGESPLESPEAQESAVSIELDTSAIVRAMVVDDSGRAVSARTETLIQVELPMKHFTSDLPVMILDNFSQGKPREVTLTSMLIYEPDAETGRTTLVGEADFHSRCQIETYGLRSSTYPKYSMQIKLQDAHDEVTSESLLGLAPGADWVLEGPYHTDHSLMRNVLMYDLSRQMGTYAPRTRFVDVFVNTDGGALGSQDYLGIYVLTEAVSEGEGRVNLEAEGDSSDGSPSGFIFLADRGSSTKPQIAIEGVTKFGLDYPAVDPAEPGESEGEATRYLTKYLNELSSVLASKDRSEDASHYSDFIDVDSWIDELILRTLSKDPNGLSRSIYFFKPLNGKLHRGPVWDLDSALSGDPENWTVIVWELPWWKDLMWMPGRPREQKGDADFMQAWTDRWQSLRQTVLSNDNIAATIERLAAEVREAQVLNFEKWKKDRWETYSTFSGPITGWENEVKFLKEWLERRCEWIDEQFVPQPFIKRNGNKITLTTGDGETEVYYTLDGTDPRLSGGEASLSATLVVEGETPLHLKEGMTIGVRAKRAIEWSQYLRIEEDSP